MKFLRAAEGEHNRPVQTQDVIVHTAAAEVSLVARDPAIRDAASKLTEEALFAKSEATYTRLRNDFIELAQAEIEPGD